MLCTFFSRPNLSAPPPGRRAIALGLLAVLLGTLGACQKAAPVPDVQALRRAEIAQPGDAQLAQKYARSCQTCHSSRVSTAPLTAFAADWQPRLAQGMPTLVAHARDGFKGMPARGFCNDCSDQDFEALILFMSSQPVEE